MRPQINEGEYGSFLLSEIAVATDEPRSDSRLVLSSRDEGNDYTHDAEKGLCVVKSLNVLPRKKVQLEWVMKRGVEG